MNWPKAFVLVSIWAGAVIGTIMVPMHGPGFIICAFVISVFIVMAN